MVDEGPGSRPRLGGLSGSRTWDPLFSDVLTVSLVALGLSPSVPYPITHLSSDLSLRVSAHCGRRRVGPPPAGPRRVGRRMSTRGWRTVGRIDRGR